MRQRAGSLALDGRRPSSEGGVMHTVRETQPQAQRQSVTVTTVGRFQLLERIGAGGMGEVFRAFDPQLDRLVALKLPKRCAPTNQRDTEQLLREAKAMAQVSHPNVVSVFDAGLDGDQPWVAMELIRGVTLREWLATPHPWPETLRLLCQIGRGLEAAHRASLVHRDLKPENVMIGVDGRVAVTDFGIAQTPWGDERRELATPPSRPGLTATPAEGAGTPGYMAPEQRQRQRTDARTDQFAFAVTAIEALCGVSPRHGGPHAFDYRAAVPAVPQRVWRALEHALNEDPARRFASMGELLGELEHSLPRRRSWSTAVLVAAVLLATGVWTMLRPAKLDPCAGASARLTDPWGPARQHVVQGAFLATGAPFAGEAWSGVHARLDRYTGQWAEMYAETCRATRVEGRQSDSLMDVRMGCLERRRGVLGQLTQLWATGMDAEAVEHAAEAVSTLLPIADCADGQGLSEWATAPDTAPASAIAAARQRLEGVEALTAAHRLQQARTDVAALRPQVKALGSTHLSAEVAYAEGDVLAGLREPSAEQALLESTRLTQTAHDDQLAARALVRLSGVLATSQQSPQRALFTIELAQGEVSRAGDEGLRAQLLRAKAAALSIGGQNEAAKALLLEAKAIFAKAENTAEVLTTTSALVTTMLALGDYAGARALGEENLTATIGLFGPEHPQVANALNSLGGAAGEGDDSQAAAGYLRRALAINEKNTGPDSATTALSLSNLGGAERSNGNLTEAQALLERAIAIRERVLGRDHPYLASSLVNLADVRRRQGFLAEAVTLDRRAVDVLTKAFGPTHAKLATALHKLGQVYEAQGDFSAALDVYRRALDVRAAALGAEHPMTLFSLTLVGSALAHLHRCAEARPLVEKAQAGLIKAVGLTHSDTIDTFAPLARCDLREGRAAKARDGLERALALAEQHHPGHVERGEERFLLAQALWALGERARALTLAARAEQALAGHAPVEQRAAHDWLEGRRLKVP
jgi:eukaryotic-like serine/threonine-protein kinase